MVSVGLVFCLGPAQALLVFDGHAMYDHTCGLRHCKSVLSFEQCELSCLPPSEIAAIMAWLCSGNEQFLGLITPINIECMVKHFV